MMKQPSIDSIDKYLSGLATPEEKARIDAWYQSCMEEKFLTESLTKEEAGKAAAKMWNNITQAMHVKQNQAVKICT